MRHTVLLPGTPSVAVTSTTSLKRDSRSPISLSGCRADCLHQVPQSRYGTTLRGMTTNRQGATRLKNMTTSTLPRLSVCARLGGNGEKYLPDVVPTSPVPSSIRMAGLADIPGIERITREEPQPAGIEPAAMSRAKRLLLTHVAFEHGALWVEQVDDEPITRAAAAIPAGQLLAQHSAMHKIIRVRLF